MQTIQTIKDEKVIAVIRSKTTEEAEKLAEAVYSGGIRLIEITLTIPGALTVINRLKRKNYPNLVIGAGTVTDDVTARLAIENGVDFVVSPQFDERVVMMCNLYQVPIIPGISNTNQVVEALKLDCNIMKIFPASMFGSKVIRALKGPFPQAEFLSTGGVDLDTIIEWLTAGAIAVGIGSEMTKEAIETGDYNKATDYARQLVEKVKEFDQCSTL
ncbi:bifunctional 4-hydroxy-2-oxoglutarate aldolase/2-dehydro-3-deoxy-phosphogluconate aldolase (plasmid) [Geobacillus stearothermophilus]|nr:bifunctional 4-hydroxy-2-oxoglutarate aldolase/2-dehydro-3-deoxy-phosphogluconate aldolase [Geobacillus stearothermophilus]